MKSARLCKCGCGESFVPNHGKRLFVNHDHTKAYFDSKGLKPKITLSCACGCNQTFEGGVRRRYIKGHDTHVARVKRWKAKNKAKVNAQKKQARSKQKALLESSRIDVASMLRSYHSKWIPAARLNTLQKAWANITGWLSTLRSPVPNKLIKQRSFVFQLNKYWKRVTSWADALTITVSYTPEPETSGSSFIYGLVDPRTLEVRYIGKTRSGIKRPREHYTNGGGRNPYKQGWIKQLKDCGLRYNIVALEVVPDTTSTSDINNLEKWWIAYGRASGWRLTNLTDGGDGCEGRVLSDETKLKLSIARKTGMPYNPPKQTSRKLKTHCAQGHEFTAENIGKAGGNKRGRRCKTCSRKHSRRYRNSQIFQIVIK